MYNEIFYPLFVFRLLWYIYSKTKTFSRSWPLLIVDTYIKQVLVKYVIFGVRYWPFTTDRQTKQTVACLWRSFVLNWPLALLWKFECRRSVEGGQTLWISVRIRSEGSELEEWVVVYQATVTFASMSKRLFSLSVRCKRSIPQISHPLLVM